MLIPLAIFALGGYWYTQRVGTPTATNPFPKRPVTHDDRLRVARDPEKLYDLSGRKTLYNKLATGSTPFSGQTRNANPRVPPPYVAPVPRNSHRVDWRSPTASSMFKNPAFKEAYKRIHQMVYGTPTAQARRGQLQVDWGYSPDKGYPIPRGRVQSWLPSNYHSPFPDSGIAPENQSEKVTHFDLLKPINNRKQTQHIPLVTGSSYKLEWQ